MSTTLRYKSVDVSDSGDVPVTLFHEIPNQASRVSWGKPAQIYQTIHDKECPCCGLNREDGFDMGRDGNGACFGARCPACEWTF